MEWENSHSQNSGTSIESSKWLAEHLKEVDQSVKAMLKLIEGGDSFAKNISTYDERRPELIAHIEGFYCMYRSLAERYDHVNGELCKHVPSVLETQNPVISNSGSGQVSPSETPDQKLGLSKFGQQAVGFDLFLSSCGGSSDLSLKEGSDSSSLSSDSESESFDSSNKHSDPHMTGDGKGLYKRIVEQEAYLPGMEVKVKAINKEGADNLLEVQDNENYAGLLKRVTKYEEELKESNKKLQLFEDEVVRLKGEVKKNEAVIVLVVDLQAQLESAQREIKMREAELEMERRRVLDLQKEVADLETQASDSKHKVGTLVEELEIARAKLKVSEDEIGKMKSGLHNEILEGTRQLQGQLELAQNHITILEDKLDSEKMRVLELQESLGRHVADVSERDQEIKELNVALSNAQNIFYLDKAKLQSDISTLSEQLAFSEARAEESEKRSKSLESKVRHCETEKEEMRCLHESQQIGLWTEIDQLKAAVTRRGELVEALNKKHDTLKLKYDMLVAEKDDVNAKVQKLIADRSSQDNQIQQLEGLVSQLSTERVELVAGSERARELIDELRLKVRELEKEVDRQRVVISDRAEEKRDAIRQLCFSLEHYRTGYQELRQAIIGQRRNVVMAS